MAKLNFKKIADQVVQKAPGLVLGAVASNYIANGIDKVLGGKATPTITAGLTVVAGAVLPAFMGGGGKKGQFMQSIADGIMAQGGLKLAKAMNLPGINGTDGWDTLSGAGDEYNTLSGAGSGGTN